MGKEQLNYEVPTATQNIGNNYVEDFELMQTQELSSYADGGDYQALDFIDEKGSIKYNDLGGYDNLIALQDDNYYGVNGEEHSNFLPLLAAPLSQTRTGQKMTKGTFLDKKVIAERRDARNKRRQTRVEGRQSKKLTEAQAQLEASKALGKGAEADAQIAKALVGEDEKNKKKGLSTGAIIGISIGALAVIGLITFFIIKKRKAGAVPMPMPKPAI